MVSRAIDSAFLFPMSRILCRITHCVLSFAIQPKRGKGNNAIGSSSHVWSRGPIAIYIIILVRLFATSRGRSIAR